MSDDDKDTIHITEKQARPGILARQVQACTTCGGPLQDGYGFAGGGLGPYGYCDKCGRVVWKCITEE